LDKSHHEKKRNHIAQGERDIVKKKIMENVDDYYLDIDTILEEETTYFYKEKGYENVNKDDVSCFPPESDVRLGIALLERIAARNSSQKTTEKVADVLKLDMEQRIQKNPEQAKNILKSMLNNKPSERFAGRACIKKTDFPARKKEIIHIPVCAEDLGNGSNPKAWLNDAAVEALFKNIHTTILDGKLRVEKLAPIPKSIKEWKLFLMSEQDITVINEDLLRVPLDKHYILWVGLNSLNNDKKVYKCHMFDFYLKHNK